MKSVKEDLNLKEYELNHQTQLVAFVEKKHKAFVTILQQVLSESGIEKQFGFQDFIGKLLLEVSRSRVQKSSEMGRIGLVDQIGLVAQERVLKETVERKIQRVVSQIQKEQEKGDDEESESESEADNSENFICEYEHKFVDVLLVILTVFEEYFKNKLESGLTVETMIELVFQINSMIDLDGLQNSSQTLFYSFRQDEGKLLKKREESGEEENKKLTFLELFELVRVKLQDIFFLLLSKIKSDAQFLNLLEKLNVTIYDKIQNPLIFGELPHSFIILITQMNQSRSHNDELCRNIIDNKNDKCLHCLLNVLEFQCVMC